MVFVEGRADENGDKIKLLVENISPIETGQEKYLNNIVINIKESDTTLKTIGEIKTVIQDFIGGNCCLWFNMINNGSSRVFQLKEQRVKPSTILLENLKTLVGEKNIKIN